MSDYPAPDQPAYAFDARGVSKRFRHAAIFGAMDALSPGETMRFANDHDPLPLLAQIQQRYGNKVEIRYIAREPELIVIDFNLLPDGVQKPQAGGCGGGGSGCGCSGM